MRYLALTSVLLGAFVVGCGRQQDGQTPPPLGPEDYGLLPGLKATPDAKLRDELARIIEEKATPELLSKTTVAKQSNAAAVLAELFPHRKLPSILAKSEGIFPRGKFELNPARLQEAIDFRKEYDAQRLTARDALKRPKCDFGIRFTAGFLADLKLIDVARVCAHLEAFRAAELLSEDKPAEAIESLRCMLRLAICLGSQKHVDARLAAAFVRGEAFRVLQAVVQHDHTTRRYLERLHAMVQEQLAAWPNDADAWIGERALGMHVYEMARHGNFTELLTEEELGQFVEEGILQQLAVPSVENLNRDELYYLETMRKIIASCGRPYYLRAELFDSISSELQERRNSPDFPLVAARVLLPDVRKGQRMQAEDRANWEAWEIALALGTGREPPPYRTSPLTGKQYQQAEREGTVVVWNFGSSKDGVDPSITVPLREGAE